MNPDASDLWQRATRAVRTARELSASDPDAAASRAYYAAFYAVSALFALDGRSFSRHTAVEAAVHRDPVRSGRWPQDRGEDYSVLLQTRDTGDYGARASMSQTSRQRTPLSAPRGFSLRCVPPHPSSTLRPTSSPRRSPF